jgi:glycine cleavage system H protein
MFLCFTVTKLVYTNGEDTEGVTVKDELITYMGYEWILVDDGVITIGINDQGLEEFTEIEAVNIPAENDEVIPDEVCGDLDTDQGPMNLYCPIEGHVVEINEAVVENPALIMEDPYGDGWLFKVEPKNASDLDEIASATTNDKDE